MKAWWALMCVALLNGALMSGALAGSWTTQCETDAITDEFSCQVFSLDTRVLLIFRRNQQTTVCIVGHDFPGRDGAVRVDKGKAVEFPDRACMASKALVNSLIKGRLVTIRRYEWPYDFPKDETGSLSGLKAAHDEAIEAVSPAKRKSKPAGEPINLIP